MQCGSLWLKPLIFQFQEEALIWFKVGWIQNDGADMGPLRHMPVAAVQPGAGLVPAVANMQGARQRNGAQISKSNAQPFVSSVATNTCPSLCFSLFCSNSSRETTRSTSTTGICHSSSSAECPVPAPPSWGPCWTPTLRSGQLQKNYVAWTENLITFSCRCGQETRVIPRILQMRNHWLRSQKESLRLEEAGLSKTVSAEIIIFVFLLSTLFLHFINNNNIFAVNLKIIRSIMGLKIWNIIFVLT